MAAPMKLSEMQLKLTEKVKFLREQAYSHRSFEKVWNKDYDTFFKNYLLPNKPCIFTQEVTNCWKSRQEWVSEKSTPNFSFLKSKFGDANVPVANCKEEQFNAHPKQDMLLSEYLDYWEQYRCDGYPENKPCLYLKDWHFTKAYPDYKAYSTPVYFQSDWLNEFWDTLPQDDYKFVYMGPKGTWTPFHADVYRSYSWSANICGKKKWVFYPPGCEDKLKDCFGNLVYDVTSLELDDHKKFPDAHKVKDEMLEVIQGEGQIIFVPSGWHHQVFNMEDTISINHNWLNGCNIDICWKHLQDCLQDVKREIENCRDMDGWNEQCQLILKACAGIDYLEFVQMLRVIAENRIERYRQFQSRCLRCTRFINDETEDFSRDAQCEKENIGPELERTSVISDLVLDHEFETNILVKKQGNKSNTMECGEICERFEKCEIGDITEHKECKDKVVCICEKETACERPLKVEGNKRNGIEDDEKCEKCEKEDGTEQKASGNRAVYICEKEKTSDKCLQDLDFLLLSRWSDKDYLTFDMNRIREILQNVILDEDYRCIEKKGSHSAEHIVKMLEPWT